MIDENGVHKVWKKDELLNDVKGGESNCCGASMVGDVCEDCHEHAEDISVDTDQVLDVVEKPLIDNLATITGIKLSDMLGK